MCSESGTHPITSVSFRVTSDYKPADIASNVGTVTGYDPAGGIYTFKVSGLTQRIPYDFTFTTSDTTVSPINGDVTVSVTTGSSGGGGVTVPCFLADAPVLTPIDYKPIASLRAGDKVQTADGRTMRIIEAGHYRVPSAATTRPYVIPAGRFGATQDLHISPKHCVQVECGEMVEAQHITGLRQDVTVTGTIDYYNLELPNWHRDNMVVAGVTVESKARVERYTVSATEFVRMLKATYGEITPALLESASKTCRILEGGRVSVPMVKRA